MFENSILLDNPSAQRVFDYLQKPEVIHKMIVFTERGLPALTGIAEDLEKLYKADPDFPLTDYRNRQAVGRMIKLILEKFGYVVSEGGLKKGTYLRDFSNAQLFKTSAVYKFHGDAEYELLITVSRKEAVN